MTATLRHIAMAVAIGLSLFTASASESDSPVPSVQTDSPAAPRESIFGDKSPSLAESHFTWGAETGASLDLLGNDMSTLDADIFFGYKNPLIKTLGVGAGIHRAFGTGTNFIPVYALLRIGFSRTKNLCFLNAKAGYSFNSIAGEGSRGGLKGSLGLGFNLAQSRRFHSHIIISYGFFRLDNSIITQAGSEVRDISLAQLTFGVNF